MGYTTSMPNGDRASFAKRLSINRSYLLDIISLKYVANLLVFTEL